MKREKFLGVRGVEGEKNFEAWVLTEQLTVEVAASSERVKIFGVESGPFVLWAQTASTRGVPNASPNPYLSAAGDPPRRFKMRHH